MCALNEALKLLCETDAAASPWWHECRKYFGSVCVCVFGFVLTRKIHFFFVMIIVCVALRRVNVCGSGSFYRHIHFFLAE
jgi:hypothetical protein